MMTPGKVYKGATATYVDTPCGHYVRVLGPEHKKFAREIAGLPELMEASKRIEDDYQTSKTHHPNHILIPIATLEGIRAALAKMEGK